MYTNRQPTRYQVGAGATTSLTSAAVDTKVFMYWEGGEVRQLLFYVTTATVSNVSIVARMLYRPVAGATTNQVVLGTLTIPTAIAADTVYYKNITPYKLPKMSQVAFEVTTAAAGGGNAGAGYWDLVVSGLSPDVDGNSTKMVASA